MFEIVWKTWILRIAAATAKVRLMRPEFVETLNKRCETSFRHSGRRRNAAARSEGERRRTALKESVNVDIHILTTYPRIFDTCTTLCLWMACYFNPFRVFNNNGVNKLTMWIAKKCSCISCYGYIFISDGIKYFISRFESVDVYIVSDFLWLLRQNNISTFE